MGEQSEDRRGWCGQAKVTDRQRGEVIDWRGKFGFLRPDGGDKHTFVSGYEMRRAGITDPEPGDRVTWLLMEAPDGRVRATDVQQEDVIE